MQKPLRTEPTQTPRPVQRFEPSPEKGAKFEPFYISGFGAPERRSAVLPRRFDQKR